MGGRKMSQNNIPSKEDFARAKAAIRKSDRGLSEVRERILSRFNNKGVHEIFLFYSPKTDTFGTYVFYSTERQIEEAAKTGLSDEVKNTVLEELEKVGRGCRGTIKVEFEFDSHENVERNYEGDYYKRLY